MFGSHVNRLYSTKKGATIVDHIAAARAIATKNGFDMEVAQIFVAGPRSLKMVMTDDEAAQLREYTTETKIRVFSHGTYSDVFYKGNMFINKFIREEVRMCERAGIAGLVLHLPNLPPETTVKTIPAVFTLDKNVRIYLETPAVSPSKSFYETPEKLATLFTQIRKKIDPKLQKLGLCIDTAHLWSCGVDISSYEKASDWITELKKHEDIIPPSHIMIHLNDSVYECGNGRDEHATLLHGKIWGEYKDNPEESGLAAFVEYAKANNTPCILERKPEKEILKDYATLHSLITKPQDSEEVAVL